MHEQGNISIHTENIFPIIKKSLYSDREIFLRELVSNGVDAIEKLKWIGYREDIPGGTPDPKITITLDKENRKLSITDTGLGMTADEVKKYINQVAFSSAEEFIEKYKGDGDGGSIIGHFGLGFYSSFMVSSLVEIDTKSYKADAPGVRWSCDGSTEYTLDNSDRTDIGTTITLTLTEEDDEFLEAPRIRQLITKYCDFMQVPIEFEDTVVNKREALWVKSPSEVTDEEYLEFYRYLYPFQEEPLFWIHINTDYPVIVKGILYFPKLRPDVDPNRGQIKLFCDQVYVTDNAEEIIPKFLMPLRGVIDVDGTDIPLNVSRSYLHNDRKVRRISDHIAKKVGDRLNDLYKEDYDRYMTVWPDISLFIKFGVMNSDKFYQRIKDIIIFKTTKAEGDEKNGYVTLADYLERNTEKQEKTVYYTNDEAAQSAYIDLHTSQGLEVLLLDGYIDSHFTGFLEQDYSEVQFKRVDSELDDTLVDEDSAGEIVDPTTNKTRSETLEDMFKSALGNEQLSVKAQALKSEAVPAMILLPEAMRRMQEMAAMMQQDAAAFQLPDQHTLVVNTSHPLVKNLQELSGGEVVGGDNLSGLICHHVYDLAMMAQRAPEPEKMKTFLERSNEVLTRLTEKALA